MVHKNGQAHAVHSTLKSYTMIKSLNSILEIIIRDTTGVAFQA